MTDLFVLILKKRPSEISLYCYHNKGKMKIIHRPLGVKALDFKSILIDLWLGMENRLKISYKIYSRNLNVHCFYNLIALLKPSPLGN